MPVHWTLEIPRRYRSYHYRSITESEVDKNCFYFRNQANFSKYAFHGITWKLNDYTIKLRECDYNTTVDVRKSFSLNNKKYANVFIKKLSDFTTTE